MRSNIVIDDELLADAQRISGLSTKRETVEYAVRELVCRRDRKQVLGLRGKVEGDLGRCRRSS
jgi:Arc/MetJ family transcription regulator